MILWRLFRARLRGLALPGVALLALLQRTPLTRHAALAVDRLASSQLGSVLRPVLATAAAWGAPQTLVGATQFVASRNPIAGTVGTPIPPAVITVTGANIPAGSFRLEAGRLPPGLAIADLKASTGIVNASSVIISGTPTAAGNYSIQLRAYERPGGLGDVFPTNTGYTVNFGIAGASSVAPAITRQPVSQTVPIRNNATFSVTATADPSPAYQWRKDGAEIGGATDAAFSIAAVQLVHAGSYTVRVSNAVGSVESEAAVLTVGNPADSPPVFAAQPVSQIVAAGTTVVFNAPATGATSYQWSRNGLALNQATSALLVVPSVTAADAGTYTVVARNGSATLTSNAATLGLATVPPADVGRLVNLSILTTAGSGNKALTIGATIGGADRTAALPLVFRAVGPTLGEAPFGLSGTMPDPVLTLNAAGQPTALATNDNWGGGATLASVFSRVGAFALGAASLDAAIFPAAPGLPVGGYTVTVADKNGATGLVLAEIYDAAGAARLASTPRLTNLSVLTAIEAGKNLAVGFVLDGATARSILVRAIGPTLGSAFGLPAVMADPQLELFHQATGRKILENNDWSGDPQFTAAGQSVGAFAIASADSRDAMLLVTLAPGSYSARVRGVGSAAGTVIVEVYELP
jgi:hypothetical protein